MMRNEEREAKGAFWLQHLRERAASGEPLSVYARRQGLDADEGYRWTRILRRAGLWSPVKQKADGGAVAALVERKSLPRFARVRIESAHAHLTSSLTLQLMLANGRRAELLLSDERQLPRVLRLLEEPS